MNRALLATMLLGALLAHPLAAAQAPVEQGPAGSSQAPPQAAPASQPPQPPSAPSQGAARQADPDPDLTPSDDLERAIERFVEEHLEEAMGSGRRGRQMTPEMERAIASAIQSEEGKEIMRAVAEKIRSGEFPGRREAALALMVPILGIGLVALVAGLFYWRSQAKTRARLEFQTQLLSKFGSGQELTAFLNSGASGKLMQELSVEPVDSKQRVLKRTRIGAGLTAVGLVFLIASPWLDYGWGSIGVFFLAIGLGFLASALATYRLSEKMGLLRDGSSTPGGKSAA